MKFASYLNEKLALTPEDVIAKLEKDCMPFINTIRPCQGLLYRGTLKKYQDLLMIEVKSRTNRKPKDTNKKVHDEADKMFQKKFGWKVRSQGVFVSSIFNTAKSYSYTVPEDSTGEARFGDTYLFFPIGRFKYVSCKHIDDFYIATKALFPKVKLNPVPGELKMLLKNNIINSIIAVDIDKNFMDKLMATDDLDLISRNILSIIVNNYTDKDLCATINTLNNEIAFKCDKYYLVDLSVKDAIVERFRIGV